MATAAAGLTLAAGGCGDSDEAAAPSSSSAPPAQTTDPPRDAGGGPRPPVGDGAGGVELEEIGDFDDPLYVTQPSRGDDNLYVVEQCGRVQRLPVDGGEPELFLDVSEEIVCGGEQGLLSIAFPPDDRDLFYVYYTDTEGTAKVVEYARSADDPAIADPESARELLSIEDFAANHNGGLLMFGPDGALYAGTGDGGGAGDPERTAQDPESLLGKLLRIDTESGETEIAALGLRNPWRYSFDRERGDLWIGDVGQDEIEEIDSVTRKQLAGSKSELNFGWSAFEGTQRFNSDQQAPGALPPTLEYANNGACSVTGGYVVRDPQLRSLYGRYLYGDFCEGQLRSFTARAGGQATDDLELGIEVPQLNSFGEDAAGRVYAVSLEGPVYRLLPAS